MKYPGAMLSEIWKHLTKKPAMVLHPFERLSISEDFRGKVEHVFLSLIRGNNYLYRKYHKVSLGEVMA